MKKCLEHVLDVWQLSDVELMGSGLITWKPRFVTRREYINSISSLNQPIPFYLSVPEGIARATMTESIKEIVLRDNEGLLIGKINVEDVWKADKLNEVQILCGKRVCEEIASSSKMLHPGANHILSQSQWRIGGDLILSKVTKKMMNQTAAEKHNCLCFITRRPLISKISKELLSAMNRNNERVASTLVSVSNGPSVCCDEIDSNTALSVGRSLILNDKQRRRRRNRFDNFQIREIPLSKRCRGPRETLLNCEIAKSLCCSHIFISPESEHVGSNSFENFSEMKSLIQRLDKQQELGIVPIFPEDETVFNGKTFERIRAGIINDRDFNDENQQHQHEAIKILKRRYKIKSKQGFCVFFTGLSSSGKSTLAKGLAERLSREDINGRRVIVLDGDVVRNNLSRGLGFSKQDRDENILRIGYVASLIAASGGIAICAPIAPYQTTRQKVKEMCEKESGGFVEVHVSTPLEECEKRDVKGLYAKARSGRLKHFTGIDDPYEIPLNPSISINTANEQSPNSISKIFDLLVSRGFVEPIQSH